MIGLAKGCRGSESSSFRRQLAKCQYLDWLQVLRRRDKEVFFHGREVGVLTAGLTKERELPAIEIDRAVERKRKFEQDPELHTYEEPTHHS